MPKKNLNKIKNIKGVGLNTVSNLRYLFGVNIKKKSEFNLPYTGILRIKKFLRVKKTTTLLQTIVKKRITKKLSIKSYKGLRHKNSYPVRGQRTHTNAKTQKKLATVH